LVYKKKTSTEKQILNRKVELLIKCTVSCNRKFFVKFFNSSSITLQFSIGSWYHIFDYAIAQQRQEQLVADFTFAILAFF